MPQPRGEKAVKQGETVEKYRMPEASPRNEREDGHGRTKDEEGREQKKKKKKKMIMMMMMMMMLCWFAQEKRRDKT